MKVLKLFSLLIISVALLWTCDKVDDPFPPKLDTGEQDWDDSVFSKPNNGIRYVLLEEFTGHTCTNCPDAAREVDRLVTKVFGDTLIPISIHATETFAAPKVLPGAPAGSYQTDHRTPESLEYENEDAFGVLLGLPRGMVSRTSESIVKDKWKTEIDKLLASPGPTIADIHVSNYFHSPTSTFKVKVEIEWLEDYEGDMNLQIQVLEDSVIDWQLDGSENVPDYVHRHMFRGSVNGAWGTSLPAAGKGEITDTSFTRSIENYLGKDVTLASYNKPNFHDFEIIVFLYNTGDFEVKQVNRAHLTSGH